MKTKLPEYKVRNMYTDNVSDRLSDDDHIDGSKKRIRVGGAEYIHWLFAGKHYADMYKSIHITCGISPN